MIVVYGNLHNLKKISRVKDEEKNWSTKTTSATKKPLLSIQVYKMKTRPQGLVMREEIHDDVTRVHFANM